MVMRSKKQRNSIGRRGGCGNQSRRRVYMVSYTKQTANDEDFMMSDRATITLSNDVKSRGVFLSRNGDRGSVAAFVLEVQKRVVRHGVVLNEHDSDGMREDGSLLFYALLYGAIREWLGYYGRNNDRSVIGVQMQAKGVRGMKNGHGCYKIDDDFTCKRMDDDFTDIEARNYNLVTAFFEKQHQALSIVSGCGAMPWLLDSEAEERIRSDIATAEVLKVNLEMRIEALHRSLGEIG